MQDYTVAVPANTSGTVYVRVVDTNRAWGATVLDAVTVDYLAFETGGGTPQPPVADFVGTPTSGDYPAGSELHVTRARVARRAGAGPSGMAGPLPHRIPRIPTPRRVPTP